jgi:CRISPR-associated protein Csb1
MTHVPSTGTPGGVLLDAKSQVVKDTVISLTALRAIRAKDEEKVKKLHRYIFGLALVAATAQQEPLLRMGCELVSDPQRAIKQEIVWCNGKREKFEMQHKDALEFALAAAESFGIGASKIFLFNPKFAMEELKKLTSKGKKGEE